jgi:ribonuclease PH
MMNVDEVITTHTNTNLRKDGRKDKDMQEIFIQKEAKTDSTSSVYVETNHLKMLVSLNGPIYQTQISKTKSDDASKMNVKVNIIIPSYYNNMNHSCNKNTIETQLEDLFSRNIFVEKYARTKLIINVEIFEFSCDILPYATMAITLALNDANIEQKGLITCSNVIYKNDMIIVDPTYEEEKNSEFKLTFGSIIDLQENNLFLQNGYLEEPEFKKVVGTAIKMCEAYQHFLISKM